MKESSDTVSRLDRKKPAKDAAPAAKKRTPATADAAPIRPTVPPARRKRRHVGLVLSLLLVIGGPVLLISTYLMVFAQPQYASKVGFTIRQEETGSASDLLGGLGSMLGASAQSHADLLFEFVQSQEIIENISEDFDLVGHYSQTWSQDPVFSIWPDATIEDMLWFWGRMVRVNYDKASGLLQIQVRARDPQTAQYLAQRIVAESEEMINRLNRAARLDATRNAEADLESSLERLRAARQALAEFRARTQIVDPQADISGRMGVLGNLQEQLASALVDYDLVSQTADENDPRLRQLQRRIDVVRNRIREERESFTQQDITVDDTDYPQLIAQFESLQVDQTFAESTYQAALTAFDSARSNASRQHMYLANFIQPTLAQRAQYPQSALIIALTFFFSLMFWAVMALVYYSLRDRG